MMRRMRWVVALALWSSGAQAAEAPVMLGVNPSECEISRALLGAAPAGCPPAKTALPAVPAAPVAPPLGAAGPTPQIATPAPAPALAAPPVAPERKKAASFLINFAFSSASIQPESRIVLDRLAAVMKSPEAAGIPFRIIGHTDGVGSDASNMALSRRRAAAVKDYLVRHHHITADRLEAIGMGKRELIDRANPRAAGNRRVEIINLGG